MSISIVRAARWCLVALVIFAAIGIYTGNIANWIMYDLSFILYGLLAVALASIFLPGTMKLRNQESTSRSTENHDHTHIHVHLYEQEKPATDNQAINDCYPSQLRHRDRIY